MTDISEGDDAWDDELLIQEYERSVQLVEDKIEELECKDGGNEVVNKETVIKKSGNKKNKNKKKEDSKEPLWMLGDACIAVFKEDGKPYEAKIVSINQSLGTCVVKYIGYENEQEQYLQELKPSEGHEAQIRQEKIAKMFAAIEANRGKTDNHGTSVKKEIQQDEKINDFRPEYVLPPPPNFLSNNTPGEPPSREDDALASMLMSWYMCGYQTGYYTAMKQK